MGKYIDKFRSLMGKRQTDQILKLLTKKKNTGQIKSIDEFSRELDSLVRELTGTVLTPSLKLFLGEQSSVIDSERFNFMLDRVEDDLGAGFEEANNIASVQSSHVAIVRDVVLKNLKAGVDELESKVNLYEFLNGDSRGFDSAIFSTFRESKEGRTGRQVDTQGLFVDPRNKKAISATFDAHVDLSGERLTLPYERNIFHPVRSIRQIFDSESPQGEISVDRPGTSLDKMIDNTAGTYWVTSTLFSSQPESMKVKLELDLGTRKEVNYIEIEPVHHRDIYVESISFEDDTGTTVSLGQIDVSLSGVTSIQFRKISARRLILTLRNENALPLQFEYRTSLSTFLDIALDPIASLRGGSQILSVEVAATTQLSDLISSKAMNTVGIPLFNGEGPITFKGVEFLTGIDNIRIGIAKYLSQGIFVSSPLTSKIVGQAGIRAKERRSYTDGSGGIVYAETPFTSPELYPFWGSIEYWVAKRDFSSEDILIRSSVFPLFPLGWTRAYHERLVLSEKSAANLSFNDIGSTIFFTTKTDGDIVVYRNGQEVPNIDDVPGSSEGWSTDEQVAVDKTPDTGDPMVFKIRVAGAGEGDIFTVSYNPITSSTFAKPTAPYAEFDIVGGIQAVDLLGDLSARIGPENVVVIDEDSNQVAETKLYLMVILRQNTSDPTLTPALEEYTLVSAKKDQTKFEAD